VRTLIERIIRDEGGASAIEYVAVAAAFGLAGAIGGALVGDAVTEIYQQFGDDLGATLTASAPEDLGS
jgi:Flp pilus assembly pilin Flp